MIEREYWKLYYENQELYDKLSATNDFIKQFLDLVRDNKIQLIIPELNLNLATDCGPYDTDEEFLKEILNMYHILTKT